jgi:hypothetical protein
MAASLALEEESGTYTARMQHPHNGYYAGDFSQTSRPAAGLRASNAERRDAPRAWQSRRTNGASPHPDLAAEDVVLGSAADIPAI